MGDLAGGSHCRHCAAGRPFCSCLPVRVVCKEVDVKESQDTASKDSH